MDCKMTRPRARRRGPRLIVGAAIAIAAAVVALAAAAQSNDTSCARADAGAPVRAEFDVSELQDLKTAIPGLGAAPELEGLGPLHIVVFDLHRGVPVLGGQGRSEA